MSRWTVIILHSFPSWGSTSSQFIQPINQLDDCAGTDDFLCSSLLYLPERAHLPNSRFLFVLIMDDVFLIFTGKMIAFVQSFYCDPLQQQMANKMGHFRISDNYRMHIIKNITLMRTLPSHRLSVRSSLSFRPSVEHLQLYRFTIFPPSSPDLAELLACFFCWRLWGPRCWQKVQSFWQHVQPCFWKGRSRQQWNEPRANNWQLFFVGFISVSFFYLFI